MATSSKDYEFKVVSVNDGGPDRIIVNFGQVVDDITLAPGTPLMNNLTLNLSADEAKGYFPGQTYKVSLTPNK